MTTNEMLKAIDSFKSLKRDFYNPTPKDERLFSEKEIETAKVISRVLDDQSGWHVAPIQGGGIQFETPDGLTIEVTDLG